MATVFNRLILVALRQSRKISIHRDITFAVLRLLFEKVTTQQVQYAHPSTSDGYTTGCTRWNCPVDTVSLESGARVHWIGRKDADYVLLYFHGMFRAAELVGYKDNYRTSY